MASARELRKMRKTIKTNYQILVEKMHSYDVEIELYSKGVITDKEHEEMNYTSGPLAQNERLLEIMRKKNEPDCLVKFIDVLMKSAQEGNRILAGELTETLNSKPNENDIKGILVM